MIADREQRTRATSALSRRPVLLAGCATAVILAGRALAATRPVNEATPLAIPTHLYAVLVTLGLLWLATAIGRAILRRLDAEPESRLERTIFAAALGLGAISTVVVLLGLGQLLFWPLLLAMVGSIAFLVRHDLLAILHELPGDVQAALAVRRSLRTHGRALALLVPISELFFLALLLHALAPPTANDVLTYHLGAPKRFLEHGGLLPLPDLQQANMPLAINMLYLLGLALGSDEMGGVLHLSLALLAAGATFSFGRRYFGERVGWFAAVTFVSTQLMLTFGTVAFVDYGLALFDFLAVYAFVVWQDTRRRGWLIASGLLVGCALASKYLGAITAVCLGVWLLATIARGLARREIAAGLAGALGLLLAFGVPAALLAAPWYLKNLVWFGNPVWPFLASNPDDFNMYVSGTTQFAGSGGLLGKLWLPVRLYLDGSVEYPAIRPPLSLVVLPLYVLLPRHRVVTALLAIAAVHLLLWSMGAHLLRYVLQVMPELSIVTAFVLARLLSTSGRLAWTRPLATGLLVIGFAFPAVIAIAVLLAEARPVQFVGLESRQAYLDRQLDNNRLVTYLNSGQEPVSGVLTIGDNRAFYLDRPVWSDVSLEQLQALGAAPDARAARAILDARGISHVLVNTRDLFWFAPFDPEGRLRQWHARFEASRAGYLEVIATHEDSTLYRVTR